jgi:eukaryotic-like serine/threonine-protein kinase
MSQKTSHIVTPNRLLAKVAPDALDSAVDPGRALDSGQCPFPCLDSCYGSLSPLPKWGRVPWNPPVNVKNSRPAPLTDKDTIVLAEFTNTTGDPVFDDTLRQGLSVQLQQSPFLSLISDQRIRRTLPLMNQPADARLTPDIARGVCVRTASAAVLEGSIAMLGSQYVLGLRATHCTSGDILADEQAARKEEVLSALSQIATRFRTRVGESLATIEKHSRPLAEATTPSLDALQAYSAAVKEFAPARRGALLQRAVELDPGFAVAHAGFGLGPTRTLLP